jgi:hypothetical protein
MHVIICGGRDYRFTLQDCAWLEHWHRILNIDRVYEGGQRGIDAEARAWAMARGIEVRTCKAHWTMYFRGVRAARNATLLARFVREAKGRMVGVLAFPGGQGTADLLRQAEAAGAWVIRQGEM